VTTTTTTQPAVQTQSTWQIDPSHSSVEFSIRHMMVSTVKGRFGTLQGTIVDNAEDPTRSSVQVEIDPASITTGDAKGDGHLRSPDFFDVEKFPTITFKSTRIEGTREEFKLTGDLRIRDRTREVTLILRNPCVSTHQRGMKITSSGSRHAYFHRRDTVILRRHDEGS
jgi:polyisoprenoid-binding protein YceI